MSITPIYKIVIIGGGASGALLAANLARRTRQFLQITIVDPAERLARGTAYGTFSDEHLLNVPAGRMSAWTDQPEHFLKWARARLGAGVNVQPGQFLPRPLYGQYLENVLDDAVYGARERVHFQYLQTRAEDVIADGDGVRVGLRGIQDIPADAVVLALGNLPSQHPIPTALPFYLSRRYVHSPWNAGVLNDVEPDEGVMLVGTGLTSVDLILQLYQRNHRGPIIALSRHGLHPLGHSIIPVGPPLWTLQTLPTSLKAAVRELRQACKKTAEKGGDWRSVVDSIRPVTQALWLRFSKEERARFLRHARVFWEIHRHRLAPDVAARLQQLMVNGQVQTLAGRITHFDEMPDGVNVTVRLRGSRKSRKVRVGKVINCTGPRSDYSKYQDPLIQRLMSQGFIFPDSLALGINSSPDGVILTDRGIPSDFLFTLGPPLKGLYWESTAIPEIRIQAERLAQLLLRRAHALIPQLPPPGESWEI